MPNIIEKIPIILINLKICARSLAEFYSSYYFPEFNFANRLNETYFFYFKKLFIKN